MVGEIQALDLTLSYLIQANCFDYLDSEIIKVSGKDVPMPYAENLEALALPSLKKKLLAQ